MCVIAKTLMGTRTKDDEQHALFIMLTLLPQQNRSEAVSSKQANNIYMPVKQDNEKKP